MARRMAAIVSLMSIVRWGCSRRGRFQGG